MNPLTEAEIRASFVNCTQGEAKRISVPHDLDERPWADLDFLGWRDPGAPDRHYLVTEHGGRVIGVALRSSAQQRGFLHRGLCSVCLTSHPGSGVALMAARKAGAAGRQGNSVGVYMCTDLACSLYVRGKKAVAPGARITESLTVEEQVDRTRDKLAGFLEKLLA
ncbi:FBP domain-containing protein [Yinghuangia seranimata]|uniref:FBP domain-containing protein n=1 Tax=Yinghuangia seranimata TaxID=408067 RepID=UPI00248B6CC8|nr:FBP domain-containing protein [Yinghuangia seranimata]MDI2130211.1 FBP domain-containing protein [Yinghuangia seranimata]